MADNNNIDPRLMVDNNIDSALKAGTSDAQPPQTLQELINHIARVSYIRGAEAANKKIYYESTKQANDERFCGLKFNLPEGVGFNAALLHCRSAMDVSSYVRETSNVAVDYVRDEIMPHYSHVLSSGVNAITPPLSSPISDKSHEMPINQQPTIEQPQIEQPQVQVTDTTTNKRKSDNQDQDMNTNKKARTDKADSPIVQPTPQLILPQTAVITSQPEFATVGTADSDMVDAPSEPNVDLRFGMGISFDFDHGDNEPQPEPVVQSEPVAETETDLVAETDLAAHTEAFIQKFVHNTFHPDQVGSTREASVDPALEVSSEATSGASTEATLSSFSESVSDSSPNLECSYPEETSECPYPEETPEGRLFSMGEFLFGNGSMFDPNAEPLDPMLDPNYWPYN
ncbi:hypothetical protein ACHAPT_011518 [Fusarium lateritium]